MLHYHCYCACAFTFFGLTSIACTPSEVPLTAREHDEVADATHTRPSAKDSFYRELLFVEYLQDRTGVKAARNWPPDDASSQHWSVLLGYGSSQHKVEILTNVYRVFEHDVERPEVQLDPDSADKDSVQSKSPHNWKILQPAYGAVPLRMFSGVARITKEDEDAVIVHFEMVYAWKSGGWNQLGHSICELPVQRIAPPAESADEDRP